MFNYIYTYKGIGCTFSQGKEHCTYAVHRMPVLAIWITTWRVLYLYAGNMQFPLGHKSASGRLGDKDAQQNGNKV